MSVSTPPATEVGLFRYANGTASRFTTRDGLAGDNVRVIIDAAAGRSPGLWIGSYGGLSPGDHKNRALLSLSTPEFPDRALEQLREIASASGEAIAEAREIAHKHLRVPPG